MFISWTAQVIANSVMNILKCMEWAWVIVLAYHKYLFIPWQCKTQLRWWRGTLHLLPTSVNEYLNCKVEEQDRYIARANGKPFSLVSARWDIWLLYCFWENSFAKISLETLPCIQILYTKAVLWHSSTCRPRLGRTVPKALNGFARAALFVSSISLK